MRYISIILSLFLLGCPVEPRPAPIPKDTNWCAGAEDNLKKLQCVDLRGDPMWVNRLGVKFQQTCEEAQLDGRIFLNPKCVAESLDCENAKNCTNSEITSD